MRPNSGVKPQDVLVVLKLISLKNRSWKQLDLALSLGISQPEIAFSLERLRKSGLIDETKKKPMRLAVVEFLIHAVKYVFPAELGTVSRGIPTAHSVGPLQKSIVADDFAQLVWPDADGNLRGISVSPLYNSVPFAVKKDSELHELLALVDSIRIGKAREKKLAAQEIEKRVLGKDFSESKELEQK